MRPGNLAPRILALLVSVTLIFPPPAFALREPATAEKDPAALAGLEEALRSGDPDALIQVASSRLAQWIAPAPAAAPDLPVKGSSAVPIGQIRAGLEEPPIWPDTTPLSFKRVEPILILQAEGGFGDLAYVRKLIDVFNARGIAPIVAVVGPSEKQAETMEKFGRFTTPLDYTLWREEEGRLVDETAHPVQGDRPRRPVLIRHFSQVNPGWAWDTANRLVPNLFQPLYRQKGKFLLIGYNAPANPFGGYLKPEQGEFLNLYHTSPTVLGPHEPNPIYTGHLFDQELKKLITQIRPWSREQRRAAALARLNLSGELARVVKSRKGWAYLYTSQGGSPTQLEVLIRAFEDAYGTAAFFTFFGKNPRRWYYPDDYWMSHEEIVASLKRNPHVSFLDLSGIFGPQERQGAPIWVVNLGDVSRESVRLLASASDLMQAPGHNTFMDAMGMAVAKVGPKVVLASQLFRAERKRLQQALSSMGSAQTLKEIVAFDRLRESGVTSAEIDQAVERLTRLLKSRKRQQRFQRDIGRLATLAIERSGNSTDGNLGNRLLDLLARVDRGAALSELISAPRQTPEAVEEVRDYQRQAAETFRRTGQEPQLPLAAGLEERWSTIQPQGAILPTMSEKASLSQLRAPEVHIPSGLEEEKSPPVLPAEGELRFERVYSLTPEIYQAIKKLEENIPEARRMPDEKLRAHLSNPEAITFITRQIPSGEIVGYLFGVPQRFVRETFHRRSGETQKAPLEETFYEMSWQVLPEHRGKGIGTHLRRIFRDEIRHKTRYRYLAFHQADRFSKKVLKRELSERYGRGNTLVDFFNRLLHPDAPDEPQQFVSIRLSPPSLVPMASGLEEVAQAMGRPLEEYLQDPEVSGGQAVRWRFLTGGGGTYDAHVQDYLPRGEIPELREGLSVLFSRLEQDAQKAGKAWVVVDAGGGLGFPLLEAMASGEYPRMRPFVVDAVDWAPQIPSDLLGRLKEEAARRQITDEIWNKRDRIFVRGDFTREKLETLGIPPADLLLLFNVLVFMDDPLGTLVGLYNQLPVGGHLLADLIIPIPAEPSERGQAEDLVRGYQAAFEDLRRHGIRAEMKVSDARATGAVKQGVPPGNPEFRLGMALVKGPQQLILQVKPAAPKVASYLRRHLTTRQVAFKLVSYEGDPTRPFLYWAPPSGVAESGLEEVAETVRRWFGPGSGPRRHRELAEFLAERGEGAIEEFVRLIEGQKGLAPGGLGPWRVPPFDPGEIPPAGLTSAGIPTPSTPEAFEAERVRLMAEVAIQRALGRQVVVNVGLGFVGSAVLIANASAKGSPYFALGYQRPSTESYYRVEYVNQGIAPIRTADPSVGRKLKAARRRGNIRATFLRQAIAVADLVIVDTELHVRKLVSKHPELSRADPGPTLKLLQSVGSLMPKEAVVVVETTVYPGFTLYDALPVLNEALRQRGLLGEAEDANLAYTFQRLEPGPRLMESLMKLERVGAGATPQAREGLRRYYEAVGFNYQIWDEVTAPEFIKDVENAYRFGLIELMGAFLRGAELAGINAFAVIEAIASARPQTHGTIRFAPALQVGGYCIPKEMVMVIWGLQSHFGLSELQIQQIFSTRLAAAVASDFRAESAVYRLVESLGELGKMLKESRILWMGVAYNPGVADTRYSGTERGLRLAAHYGARSEATDPYVRHWAEIHQQRLGDPESWGYGLLNQEPLKELEVQTTEDLYRTIHPRLDAIVLSTRHPQYIGQGQPEVMRSFGVGRQRKVYPGLDPVKVVVRAMGREGKMVVDTFDFLSDTDIRIFLALGWKVRGFGKGHIDKLAQEVTPAERREATQRLLEELTSLRGRPEISQPELEEAIHAVSWKLEYLRTLELSFGSETPAVKLAEAQYRLARARQELRYALASQATLLQARLRLHQAQVDLLQAQIDGRSEEELFRLEDRVGELSRQAEELEKQRREVVLEGARQVLVQPAREKLGSIFRRAAELLKTFLVLDQDRALVAPASVAEAVRIAESYLYLRDRAEGLAMDLDRAFEELVAPEAKAAAAQEVRRSQARPELAFPLEEVSVIYTQGPDGRLRRLVDPEGHPNRLSVKTVKDMANGKRAIPHGEVPGGADWSKYTKLVPLNLVPAEDIQFEAYPDFQGLPWEFRHWLLAEAVGWGAVRSTMDGIPQERIGYAMDVNLDPKTVARGRGGILFFKDTRQPLAITTDEGKELMVDFKAVGPYEGGDPAKLGYTFERVTSTGMVAGGAVGRMRIGQVPGHMSSAEEVPRLHRLIRTEEAAQGQTPRPLFRIRWKYRDGPNIEFQMVARASPTNQRIGQIFIGGEEDFDPAKVARIMGENAALVLTQPIAGVHEGLNGDNIMANGHYTDLAGLVDLFNERDPYGPFFKYFGFSLQLVVYSFEEISRNDTFQPEIRYVQDWLEGFLDRFLAAERGEKVRNQHRFTRFYQPGEQVKQPIALVEDLIRTLWEHYLPYPLLKNRLDFGYDPTGESVYSSGSMETLYHPESKEAARKFIQDQRDLIAIAERIIREEGYDPLPFDFAAATQELDAKARRIDQILASQPAPDQPVYAEIYRLSFYPPKAPEVYPVLSDVEAMMRGEAAVRLIQRVAEPTVFYDKSDVTAQAQLAARRAQQASQVSPQPAAPSIPQEGQPPGAGLEEGSPLQKERGSFTLEELKWAVANREASGLKAFLEQTVPSGWTGKPVWMEKELEKVQRLIREAARRELFLRDLPMALVRTTGRARIFMGHPDLPAIGGFSIDVATPQGMWALLQLTPDGQVVAENLDPRFARLNFGMQDPDVLPDQADEIRSVRPDWFDWADRHLFEDRWEGLVKGTLAVIRTRLLDPSRKRRQALRGKGIRLLLGESDIPKGKGFSASSSLPAAIGLALNGLWQTEPAEVRLSADQLRKLDLAAYVVRDWAGISDITAILEGRPSEATVISYDPDFVWQRIPIPRGLRLFAVDTGKRLDAPGASEEAKNYAAYIKKLTNVAPQLAVLWMRHLASATPGLRPLEGVLMARGDGKEARKAVKPIGVLRGLTSYGSLRRRRYERMVGGRGQEARAAFLENLLYRVPNDWTLGQIAETLRASPLLKRQPELHAKLDGMIRELAPIGAHRIPLEDPERQEKLLTMKLGTVIPMRQIARYGINEIERGQWYIQAAQEGDIPTLIRLMQEAHDGDRAILDHTRRLAGIFRLTPWGKGYPPEGFLRSLPRIDAMVDRFQAYMEGRFSQGGDHPYGRWVAAARISGAGLGGYLMVAVPEELSEGALAYWRRQRPRPDIVEVVPSAGARLVRFPLPAATGLEEKPLTLDMLRWAGMGWQVREPAVLRGDTTNPEFSLRHGVSLVAEGGEAALYLDKGVLLEPHVVLVAPQGHTVRVGPGTRILSGTKIWGGVTIGAGSQIGGTVIGKGVVVAPNAKPTTNETVIGDEVVVELGAAPAIIESLIGPGTQFATGSNTVVSRSLLVPFQGKPVKVNLASSIAGSVIWGGSALYQDVKVRDSVLGPFVVLGNDVVSARSIVLGAGPKNDSSGAHYNGILTTTMIPIEIDSAPYSDAYHEELRSKLAAFLYGTERARTTVPLVTEEQTAGFPVRLVRSRERVVMELDGARFEMGVQGINSGLGASSSNLNPLNQGDKGPAIISAGAMFGDYAVWYHPVFVGPRALVGIHAIVSGEEALRPGTMVRPRGTEKPVLPGVVDKRYGTIGPKAEERVRVHLEAVRMYTTIAEAFAAGLSKASNDFERQGIQKSLQITQTIQAEVAGDLAVYLAKLGESAKRLPDLIAKASAKEAQQLEQWRVEQEGLFKRQSELLEQIRAAQTRVAAVQAAGMEKYTIPNVQTFANPIGNIVVLAKGSPAFTPESVERGLQRVREGRPLFILFGAGAFSRFVESVQKASPTYAQVARDRGLVNADGNASKLTAPMGVSGLGPILRQLESLSELGYRAQTPVDLVIVDSPGNRSMLLRAFDQDRSSQNPRIAWAYLNILPEGNPVDQGEGLQVKFRDANGSLKSLFEFNPETGQVDRPVLRPSGEYGAFLAGVRSAQEAGIHLWERDIIPIYGDQAMLYTDPDFLAAVLGTLEEADIAGLNIPHRYLHEEWIPSGGVWAQAYWSDGTSALVVVERNVRDPNARGVYNPALDRDELAAIQRSPQGVGFPYNAGAPIFSGRFVVEELLDPAQMSARMSPKRIQVRTGPNSWEPRDVLVTEMELTEAVEIGTQRPPGGQPRYRAQMLVSEEWRYQGIKSYGQIQPANQEVYRQGVEWLRLHLGDRLEGNPRFVEVSPRARGFRGDGRLRIAGNVGVVIDRRGLWVHRVIAFQDEEGRTRDAQGRFTPPVPDLFTPGRLLIPSDQEGTIPLSGLVEITPAAFEQPGALTGLEEPAPVEGRTLKRLEQASGRPLKPITLQRTGIRMAEKIGYVFRPEEAGLPLLFSQFRGLEDEPVAYYVLVRSIRQAEALLPAGGTPWVSPSRLIALAEDAREADRFAEYGVPRDNILIGYSVDRAIPMLERWLKVLDGVTAVRRIDQTLSPGINLLLAQINQWLREQGWQVRPSLTIEWAETIARINGMA